MRSRSRSASRLTFHPIVIASAVVFVILFLALDYHTGVNHAEQAYVPRVQEIDRDLAQLHRRVEGCNAKSRELTKEISNGNNQLQALLKAVADLQKEQDDAQAAYKALEGKNGQCEVDRMAVESRISERSAKDEQDRYDVEELTKEVDALQVSIQQITHGDGMSIVLLSETVKTLRASYTARCRTLPGCVELSDEQLLSLHIEENKTQEEIRNFLERDAAAQRDLANSLKGPSANFSGIYLLPSVEEERQWDAKAHYPTYFKRSIAQKPLRGVRSTVSTAAAAGNVLKLLDTFGTYAMCAYRYHNPKFSFQSAFAYVPEARPAAAAAAGAEDAPFPVVPALLHELIVTPLLQYCVQCDARLWKQQYHLACFKDHLLTPRNYGTRDFWAVRSMIQAAPVVQKEALHYYESQAIEKLRVLAVVLHLASERDREYCDRAAVKEYGIHYQYLLANFPNDTALQWHVAEDHQAQCSPTPEQILERLEQVRNTSAGPAMQGFDKIYLSVSGDTRSNLEALMNQRKLSELKALLLPAYTNAQKEAATPGLTELVDLEIASRATDILVSPFLRASRYVTEQFLLRHKLNPSEHVWTF